MEGADRLCDRIHMKRAESVCARMHIKKVQRECVPYSGRVCSYRDSFRADIMSERASEVMLSDLGAPTAMKSRTMLATRQGLRLHRDIVRVMHSGR